MNERGSESLALGVDPRQKSGVETRQRSCSFDEHLIGLPCSGLAFVVKRRGILYGKRMIRRGLLICLSFLFGSHVARADFRLCNSTGSRISIALAYTDGQTWLSEGWWNLKASACETLLRGPLAAQYYYVYGMDESGGEWKGKAFMCTRDREFRIDGRQDCFVRGYDRTGFFEIDTGKDARNWTVQLTDAAKTGAGQ